MADLLRQEVTGYRSVSGEMQHFAHNPSEPLALQLEHFLDLIDGVADPDEERRQIRPAHALAEQRTVQLEVKGMNCATCPLTVRLALKKVAGVSDAKVTLEPPLAIVTYEDSKTSAAELARATTKAGYPSTPKAVP